MAWSCCGSRGERWLTQTGRRRVWRRRVLEGPARTVAAPAAARRDTLRSVLPEHASAPASLGAANGPLRWGASVVLIAIGFESLVGYPLFARLAGPTGAYGLGTLILLAVGLLLPVVWPAGDVESPPQRGRRWTAVAVALPGVVLLYTVASRLLVPVFAGPPDPMRGDMLVIIDHAVSRLLSGHSPYAVYQVPWDAPLSYGPLLWLPHVPSAVLGVDFRVLTLAAQLTIPACGIASAALAAGQGRGGRAVLWFALAAATALHGGLLNFHAIGHTQIYWPLLPVLCLLLSQRRWTAATICLGLLGSARTPLLALAPVFFIHLFERRELTVGRVSAFVVAAVGPYLPFLLVDAHAVKDGVFDTYIRVMKTYVWTSTDWATSTYGITGRLLERGLGRDVEIVQIVALLLVYLGAWRALRRGRAVEPWLALALLVFAMTTLWSVTYLYFDVWLLLISALIVLDGGWRPLAFRRPTILVGAAGAASLLIVLAAGAIRPGAAYALDIGAPAAAGYTGAGFGRDVTESDEGRSLVWLEGTTARIRLPRAGWRAGRIRLAIRPLPGANDRQGVTATLNGRALGAVWLTQGWQDVSFAARRGTWHYGFNLLELQFVYARPAPGVSSVPRADGAPRALAAALDSVTVE